MSDAIRDDLDREPFGVTDRSIARLPVAHDSGQLQCFGDPATVVFAVQLNGHIHISIVQPAIMLCSRR